LPLLGLVYIWHIFIQIEVEFMNGYIAIWRSKKIEVYAETSYEAQQKAQKEFGNKKGYEISVVLAEKNVDPETMEGEQVTHSTQFV
jgi:hypothetical protein